MIQRRDIQRRRTVPAEIRRSSSTSREKERHEQRLHDRGLDRVHGHGHGVVTGFCEPCALELALTAGR
jgi:hypothetical protein